MSPAAGAARTGPCRTARRATPLPTARPPTSGTTVNPMCSAAPPGIFHRMRSRPSLPMKMCWPCRRSRSPRRTTGWCPMSAASMWRLRRMTGAIPSGTGSAWTPGCWWWRSGCKTGRPSTAWPLWQWMKPRRMPRISSCRMEQTCFKRTPRRPRTVIVRGHFLWEKEIKPALPHAAGLVLQ